MAQRFSSVSAPSWFSASAANRQLLSAVVQHWAHPPTADTYLQQALDQPDVELDVLVGAYRYYFYNHQDALALQIAQRVMAHVRQTEQWPEDWSALQPLLLQRLEQVNARLYLTAYAASGLLLARLGDRDPAQTIAAQVQQIDAKAFGVEVLLSILNAPGEAED
jgi:hypothetical protein